MSEHKKSASSFWVPSAHIDALIRARATAMEISAFLTLAAFTDESGRFTSASRSAIRRYTATNPATARRALRSLMSITLTGDRLDWPSENPLPEEPQFLVYSADAWLTLTGEPAPPRPTERGQVRHVIDVDTNIDIDIANELADATGHTSLTSDVWFPRSIVDGPDKPLRSLKAAGDAAARLLLRIYQRYDAEGFFGLPPRGNIYEFFASEDTGERIGSFRLYHATGEGMRSHGTLARDVSGACKALNPGDPEHELLFDAVDVLKARGFIYPAIVVLDRPASDDPDVQPLYELYCNCPPDSAERQATVGSALATLASNVGHPVANASGRMHGKYAVLVPDGQKFTVVGIIRLRHRITNQKNYAVTSAWTARLDRQEQAVRWIKQCQQMIRKVPTPGGRLPNREAW